MERNTQTPKHRVGGLPPRYSTCLLDQALDPNPSTNKKQNFQRTTTKRKPHKTSLLMTPLKEHLTMSMWGNISHKVARNVPRSSKFKSSLWMKEKERKTQPRLSVGGGRWYVWAYEPGLQQTPSTPWEGLKKRYTVSVAVRGVSVLPSSLGGESALWTLPSVLQNQSKKH